MLGGSISDVVVHAVALVQLVKTAHHPIASHLRDNRGCRDRQAYRVAIDQSDLRYLQVGYERVEQEQVHIVFQGMDGSLHRQPVGRRNPKVVDLETLDDTGADGNGAALDHGNRRLTRGPRHQLGVVHDSLQSLPPRTALDEHRIEDDRRCHQRTGQGAATDLVHARDALQAYAPEISFPVKLTRGHRSLLSLNEKGRGSIHAPILR